MRKGIWVLACYNKFNAVLCLFHGHRRYKERILLRSKYYFFDHKSNRYLHLIYPLKMLSKCFQRPTNMAILTLKESLVAFLTIFITTKKYCCMKISQRNRRFTPILKFEFLWVENYFVIKKSSVVSERSFLWSFYNSD